jgi:hypothetical protein
VALLRLRVTAVAAATPLIMRLPLDKLGRILESGSPRATPTHERTRDVEAAVERVLARAGGRIVPAGCLTRAVTRYWFLQRAGEPVVLCFGVGRPQGGAIEGHAWVLRAGEPYREQRDPRAVFNETWRSPRGTAP